MRRAAGDAAGRTIAAQIKRAMENLGYGANAWRVREAWYGRAGRWSAAALADLRRRYAAWQCNQDARRRHTLVERVGAIRRLLGELEREVEVLEVEVERLRDSGDSRVDA